MNLFIENSSSFEISPDSQQIGDLDPHREVIWNDLIMRTQGE